jgi:hypothetical protein
MVDGDQILRHDFSCNGLPAGRFALPSSYLRTVGPKFDKSSKKFSVAPTNGRPMPGRLRDAHTRSPRERFAQIATLVVFVCIISLEGFAAVDRARAGETATPLTVEDASSNTRFVVSKTLPLVGLNAGDHVTIDDPGLVARYQLRDFAVGESLPVTRTEPLPRRRFSIPVIAAKAQGLTALPLVLLELVFIGVALLIAARGRPGVSLQLAWVLALIVLLVNPTTPAWPGWMVVAFLLSSASFASVAFASGTDFATRLSESTDARWPKNLRRASIALATFTIVINLIVSVLSIFTPTMSPLLGDSAVAALLVQAGFFLSALIVAYRCAPVGERQRIAWVALSLATGSAGFIGAVAVGVLGVSEPQRDVPLLLLIVMPLGLAYAILRYRLLDIGFVVNRATVFGITSLLVIAALALIDFGLQNIIGSWLLRTGLYVQLGLALAIGIATRPLHARVDSVVDDLFFRKRHDAERALRAFARDVSYIDDAKIAIDRAVKIVAATEGLSCAIFLAEGRVFEPKADSSPENAHLPIDRNDGAVVRMLATRERVDLLDVTTSLAGDFVFPMFARNQALGFMLCDARASGVAYAPDELSAIDGIARAIAIALDLLRIEELERRLARLEPVPE